MPAAKRPSSRIGSPAPASDTQMMAQPSTRMSAPPAIISLMPSRFPSRGAARAKPKSATERGSSDRPAAIGVMASPVGDWAKRL